MRSSGGRDKRKNKFKNPSVACMIHRNSSEVSGAARPARDDEHVCIRPCRARVRRYMIIDPIRPRQPWIRASFLDFGFSRMCQLMSWTSRMGLFGSLPKHCLIYLILLTDWFVHGHICYNISFYSWSELSQLVTFLVEKPVHPLDLNMYSYLRLIIISMVGDVPIDTETSMMTSSISRYNS